MENLQSVSEEWSSKILGQSILHAKTTANYNGVIFFLLINGMEALVTSGKTQPKIRDQVRQ